MLTDIELYYSSSKNIVNGIVKLDGQEAHHAMNVMRHQIDDELFITDGKGKIYKSIVNNLSKRELTAEITEIETFNEKFPNIVFCLPRLKNNDRFEFGLEKCVELGITNFIIFTAERSIAKGEKLERWNKIALSAMKQSLHAILPIIKYSENAKKILSEEGEFVIFDQKGKSRFTDKIEAFSSNISKKYYLIFGPEGGLSNNEIDQFESRIELQLTVNRLRAETAVITAASILNQ